MPPERVEVQAWLRKARGDARMAEAGLAQRPPVADAAAFHCQQAVEKCLKAFLVHHRQDFEHTHDLDVLVDRCVAMDGDWESVRDQVEPLTAYAVRFRYPGPADPTVAAVQEALDVVRIVWDFVLARLPDDVKP